MLPHQSGFFSQLVHGYDRPHPARLIIIQLYRRRACAGVVWLQSKSGSYWKASDFGGKKRNLQLLKDCRATEASFRQKKHINIYIFFFNEEHIYYNINIYWKIRVFQMWFFNNNVRITFLSFIYSLPCGSFITIFTITYEKNDVFSSLLYIYLVKIPNT